MSDTGGGSWTTDTGERERALLVAVSHRATGRCDDTPTGQCHVQGRGMKAQLSCLIHYRRLFLLDFSVSFFKNHENPILEMPNWVFLEFIWDGVILPLRSAWHLRSLFSDIHLFNFFFYFLPIFKTSPATFFIFHAGVGNSMVRTLKRGPCGTCY